MNKFKKVNDRTRNVKNDKKSNNITDEELEKINKLNESFEMNLKLKLKKVKKNE